MSLYVRTYNDIGTTKQLFKFINFEIITTFLVRKNKNDI